MTNIEQLAKAFADFYDGSPWYGSSFRKIIDDITDGEALAFAGNQQSIARLLCHMNKWRRSLTIRLQGNTDFRANDTDPDNWLPMKDIDAAVWENAKKEFGQLQQIILEELGKRNDTFLDELFVPGGNERLTYRYLINGVVEHDIYHLGQISLMKQLLRAANPKS